MLRHTFWELTTALAAHAAILHGPETRPLDDDQIIAMFKRM